MKVNQVVEMESANDLLSFLVILGKVRAVVKKPRYMPGCR